MLVVRIWEGLGNQMFQYAYAKSYEIKERGIVISLNAEIQYASLIPEI